MTFKGMELASLARVQKLRSTGIGRRCGARRSRRTVGNQTINLWVFVSLFAVATVLGAGANADSSATLDLEGMTFVASREDGDAVVLHAVKARFDTEAKKAYLQVVDATVPPNGEQQGFEMRCDSGVVDLESNDFEARGNVKGHADSGEIFTTDWVRYDHANGIIYTDSPVLITDDGTTIRGGGFRYDVAQRRFQLTGGARVVQTPKSETATEEIAQ